MIIVTMFSLGIFVCAYNSNVRAKMVEIVKTKESERTSKAVEA